MTNLIITADWHIRIKPDIPEAWQVNRYRNLFQVVINHCKQRNAQLILAGDIFDRNRPSLLEMQLFTELVTDLNAEGITTWLISGNHETIGRGESTFDYFVPLFQTLPCITYNTSNEIFHPFTDEGCDLYLVGHPALSRPDYARSELRGKVTNILVSHFRCTVNQFIQEELNVEKFTEWFDHVFAGDIHMPYQDDKLVYTNHPINSSFETTPNCGLLHVTLNNGEVTWKRVLVSLPNLIQISTTAAEFADTLDDYHYYRIEVTGTPEELREISTESGNTKLLKVPDVVETYVESEDAEEVRDTDLETALLDYLRQMDLEDDTIVKMMTIFKETT